MIDKGGNGKNLPADGGYGADQSWEIEAGRLSANHTALQRDVFSLAADERECKERTRAMLSEIQHEIARLAGILSECVIENRQTNVDVAMIAAVLQRKDLGK